MAKKREIMSIYNLIDAYDEMIYELQRDKRQFNINIIFSFLLSLIVTGILYGLYWLFIKFNIYLVNKLDKNVFFIIVFFIFVVSFVWISISVYDFFSTRGMNKILKEIRDKCDLKQEEIPIINEVLKNIDSQEFEINKNKYIDYNTVNSIFYFKTCLIYEQIDNEKLKTLHKELEEIKREKRKMKTISLASFFSNKNNIITVIILLLFNAIISNHYNSLFNNFIELKDKKGYMGDMLTVFWHHILCLFVLFAPFIFLYCIINFLRLDPKKIEMDKLKVITEALYCLKEGLEINSTVNTSVKLDEETKKEAQKLFKDLGLNLSTAINIFLKQAVREKGIPFYISSLPENSELSQALEEAKKIKKNPSNYKSYNTPKEIFVDVLGEDFDE